MLSQSHAIEFIQTSVCSRLFSYSCRSFGDYFKEDAIKYAWELLTEVYGLDPDRIYATYFQGNDQVEADLEAKELWLQYLPPERVIG